MALGIICIVTDAQRNNINLVFAARGMGPEAFSRKLCAIDPGATSFTPATHWLSSDAMGNQGELNILTAMTEGDLPPVPEGVIWGEEGVIAAAHAMAATNGAVFQVYSAAGDVEPVNHAAAVLASRGLQFVPDPEL
ncbi:hypothetical protein [Devosia sediminis]|uniref:Uncharacterized protein n=1 Tax=Devosia sediminis TaxID=2798801 RepID=A0A934MIW9_9HYPH|nr:hypothetical protein [Devosia sediminis]MBJ3783423.1 hypothetical protein [Devosia sediminis]